MLNCKAISAAFCVLFLAGPGWAEALKGMTNTIIDTKHGIIGGFLTKDTTFQQVLNAGIPVKAAMAEGYMSEGTEVYLVTHLFPGTKKELIVLWDCYDPKALEKAGYSYHMKTPLYKGIPEWGKEADDTTSKDKENDCVQNAVSTSLNVAMQAGEEESAPEAFPLPLPLPDSKPLAVNTQYDDSEKHVPGIWQTDTGLRVNDGFDAVLNTYPGVDFNDQALYSESYGEYGASWCCYGKTFPNNVFFRLEGSVRPTDKTAKNDMILIHANKALPAAKLRSIHIQTIFFKFRKDIEFFDVGIGASSG